MNVTVDEERCRGHAACWARRPEVFDLSEDGYAVVLTPQVPAEHEADVRDAAAHCPERAITVS